LVIILMIQVHRADVNFDAEYDIALLPVITGLKAVNTAGAGVIFGNFPIVVETIEVGDLIAAPCGAKMAAYIKARPGICKIDWPVFQAARGEICRESRTAHGECSRDCRSSEIFLH